VRTTWGSVGWGAEGPCPRFTPPFLPWSVLVGLPKMEASQSYSGIPPPPGSLGAALRLGPGDIVEVTVAEAEQLWWQVGMGLLRWGWDPRGHGGMDFRYGGRAQW